jgi:hypothetical protein
MSIPSLSRETGGTGSILLYCIGTWAVAEELEQQEGSPGDKWLNFIKHHVNT